MGGKKEKEGKKPELKKKVELSKAKKAERKDLKPNKPKPRKNPKAKKQADVTSTNENPIRRSVRSVDPKNVKEKKAAGSTRLAGNKKKKQKPANKQPMPKKVTAKRQSVAEQPETSQVSSTRKRKPIRMHLYTEYSSETGVTWKLNKRKRVKSAKVRANEEMEREEISKKSNKATPQMKQA